MKAETTPPTRSILGEKDMFIGAYVPEHMVHYLRLVSLRDGQSVQKIIQQLVEEEMERTPTEEVIDEIAWQVIEAWPRPRDGAGQDPKARENFWRETEDLLNRKKIRDVDRIMEKVRKAIDLEEGK